MAKKKTSKAKMTTKSGAKKTKAKIPINPVTAGENFAENIGKKFGWKF
jgi:hypothetical protein